MLHCFKIVTQLQVLRYSITSGKRLCQASGTVEHSVPVPVPGPVPVPVAGSVFLQAHILATQSSTAGASCCRIFLAWGSNGDQLLQVAAGTRCWQDPEICIELLGTTAVARNQKHRIISQYTVHTVYPVHCTHLMHCTHCTHCRVPGGGITGKVTEERSKQAKVSPVGKLQ